MRAAGNFFWFIFGGLVMGLSWWLAGVLMYISIIGIPFGKACFTVGKFAFFPFGKAAIDREKLSHKRDVGTSGLGALGNVVWFLLCGWWLALGHVLTAAANFASVIGIFAGIQHFKIAGLALSPIGKTIVPQEVAEEVHKQGAKAAVAQARGHAPAQQQQRVTAPAPAERPRQRPGSSPPRQLDRRDSRELPPRSAGAPEEPAAARLLDRVRRRKSHRRSASTIPRTLTVGAAG